MTIRFAERGDKKALETQLTFSPKFDDNGLIPVIATDHQTNEVLMVAFMNETALKETLTLGEVVYWSRSRSELWHKGKTSGNIQKVVEIRTDCDQDALVIRVEQVGEAACHTGRRSCFYRSVPFGKSLSEEEPVPLHEIDSIRLFDPEAVYGKK